MTLEITKLKALSIRQPWADLIVRRLKTIEVRAWQVSHRGPFLIHVSNTIDWKSVEALGYADVESLPRRRIVAYAEISDVFQFDRELWLRTLKQHWVVHPLVQPSFGAVLTNVKVFTKSVPCSGNLNFFSLPPKTHEAVAAELRNLGMDIAGVS
jgi:hypothetical protein